MQRREEYSLRASRLHAQVGGIDDPVARVMLCALIDALHEAAGEDLQWEGQKPSSDRGY
jgi:hypothetical protein